MDVDEAMRYVVHRFAPARRYQTCSGESITVVMYASAADAVIDAFLKERSLFQLRSADQGGSA